MKLKVKTSKIVLFGIFALLVAFVVKMIQLYETTGGVPDTLVSCVLGGGLAELALTAWITVSKVKKDALKNNSDESGGVG